MPDALVTIPSAVGMLQGLPTRHVAFNRSDLHSAFPEVDREVVHELEQQLLRGADTVLYVSHALMRCEHDVVGDRGFYLGHGVDVDHFRRVAPSQWPSDIARVPGPRIGFFGGLDDYVVNLGLLDRLCKELPDCQIVLIGDATCDMTSLQAHPNLTWLGMRNYEEIPAYGSAFDIGIMPWLDNEWIAFCNPVKLKEYLALGLPVVTTDFPELGELRSAVRVARPEDFAQAVRAALTEPQDEATRDARRQLVVGHTWESKAMIVERLMDGTTGDR
jgi:glycosyltransferase involved in cell wall biosynthesis